MKPRVLVTREISDEAAAKIAFVSCGGRGSGSCSASGCAAPICTPPSTTRLSTPTSRTATLDAVAQAASEALGGDVAAVLIPQRGRLAMAGSHDVPASFANSLAVDGTLARAARIVGTTDGNVRARLHHARRALRQLLAPWRQQGELT